MSVSPIRSVVIVGGGTAGWMAAASLAFHLQSRNIAITVIESPSINTIGVGEATLPGIVHFNHNIGIDEIEFFKKTNATFKLGIQFEDWKAKDSQFFHPFSDYGEPLAGIDFHHYIERANQSGQNYKLQDFSLPYHLSHHKKFKQPNIDSPRRIDDFSYAYHFDAGLYADLLKEHAIKLGVTYIEGTIRNVSLNSSNGHIEQLMLDSGKDYTADFYVDCSGFKGLLIEESLGTGFEDWSHWLLCDSAIAVQSSLNEHQEIPPYTRTIAQNAGWVWRIPLQQRMGNGYVYSSSFINNDQAEETLAKVVTETWITSPRKINFKAGRRKKIWNKNCYAIGLASGFLEPLESTSISLIQSAISRLLTYFPDKDFHPAMQKEVNNGFSEEMEGIRDFIILHYRLSQRRDSEFWKHCREMSIPESLQHKIDLFERCGIINCEKEQSFEASSWLSMYYGFDLQPHSYDRRANAPKLDQVISTLDKMQKHLSLQAQHAPKHDVFLKTLTSH